jgi:hypothetical protein
MRRRLRTSTEINLSGVAEVDALLWVDAGGCVDKDDDTDALSSADDAPWSEMSRESMAILSPAPVFVGRWAAAVSLKVGACVVALAFLELLDAVAPGAVFVCSKYSL